MQSANGSGVRRSERPSSSGFALLRGGRHQSAAFTAWPPNSLRSAALTFAAKLSSSRDAKRAKSEAEMTGAGTFSAIASKIVQRPSPESSTYGAMSSSLAPCLLERVVQELEQPGADDRAVAPDAGDLVQVEAELRVLHDLEALGVRLHEAVLDPVVHHLREVARAGRADVRVAVRRRERGEDRLQPLDRLGVAADHRAEADLQAPDAAGDAGVDEVEPLRLRGRVATLRVAEVRVAAVDDRVARVRERQQLLEGVLGDLPGRDHHPEGARRVELRLQLRERRGGARLDGRVVRLHVVAVLAQTLRHSVAHAAEADHPELHRGS